MTEPSGRMPKPKDIDLTGAVWHSAPDSPGGPQVAFIGGYIAMRNSVEPDGPVLVFDQGEWDAFRAGAEAGEFNSMG
ncbi:DUF397 domain-containing protein [Kitasatospora sp. NPDC092286]|uniref:DUF397 domain-containing protein n=1 Tax=Kitasatospora sp. NPDC092286 TaxID=3364087 RepID=UPI003807AB6D